MTIKEKNRIANMLRARLKDKTAMRKAAQTMDALLRKFGKPSEGFDSLSLLRRTRASR